MASKALNIKTDRANGGLRGDILEAILDNYFVNGMSIQESLNAVQDQIIQAGIDRYADKIGNALARAGLVIDGPLSVEAIKAAVVEKSGLDLSDLSPEGMLGAVDSLAARRLSDEIGIEVASIRGADLGETIKAGVAQAVAEGRAAKLLGRAMSGKVRKLATWNRAGVAVPVQSTRIAQKVYQKRYRRRNKEVWVRAGIEDESGGH